MTTTRATFDDGDVATCDVLTGALVDIGLEKIIGKLPAYINVTHSFINGTLPLPESKEQIVLELMEDLAPSSDLVIEVNRLVENGYRVALDNFHYRPEYDPLLDLVNVVKLNLKMLTPEEVGEHVERLRRFDVKVIAQKVETYEELEWCQTLEIDYFQGFFFCKPRIISGRCLDANRLVVLKLLAKLQDVSTDFNDVEELISCDSVLSYRLLRHANSAYCGLRCEVTSIHHALVLVGVDRVRQWSMLLIMSRLVVGKPAELFTVAMIRAKMCELLGEGQPEHSTDEYFMVGLLSVLDALTDQPMDQALSDLPLSTASKRALMKLEGPLGRTLGTVIRYESAHDPLDGGEALVPAYLSAICWANEILEGLAM